MKKTQFFSSSFPVKIFLPGPAKSKRLKHYALTAKLIIPIRVISCIDSFAAKGGIVYLNGKLCLCLQKLSTNIK